MTKTLAQRIAAARERLGPEVTQEVIGKAFGITDKAVSSWERGDSAPARGKMPKLARLLKVPLHWLLEGGGPVPEPNSLVMRIEALDPDDQITVENLVDSLAKRRGKVA